jgi:anti-anti-sigma factor
MNGAVIAAQSKAVVEAAGDLVAARVPALRAEWCDLVDAGVLHLTLDLAATQTVDSAGLGLLIAAHNSLNKAGGDLTAIHAAPHILDLFRTLGIDRHFNIPGCEVTEKPCHVQENL